MAKKKRHGHFCWGCGRRRPNEAFSGGGHARHQCRDCRNAERRGRRVLALMIPIAPDDERGFVDDERLAVLLRFEASSPE